jgi:hypothetical protein
MAMEHLRQASEAQSLKHRQRLLPYCKIITPPEMLPETKGF